MGTAAEKVEPRKPESKVVKISSKRQVTIPAEWYREQGFSEYALVTRTETGFTFEPLEVKAEDATERILRELIGAGYEGEELLEKYKEANAKIKSVREKIEEAEADIAAGRVGDFDEMIESTRKKYGLFGYSN